MNGWLHQRIAGASWAGFAIWFVILMAFSTWAFSMDSPWTRALEAAGGVLPETKPGIPAIEPVRSLQAMGAERGDYLLWQALDVPYALMNFFVIVNAIGLGLKALRLDQSFLRFLVLLPTIYVGAELVENAFLTAFAAELIATNEPLVLTQQFATTMKFGSGMPGLALGFASLIAAFVVAALRFFKRKPSG
ncbi:MAG: hypothetical protein AAFW68_01410 [Pseudomonadota bacterium]